jgi:hypothetical protein
MPQRDEHRAAGERFMLVNESGRTIGELMSTGIREAFRSCVLHRGKQYKVVELDIQKKGCLQIGESCILHSAGKR